MDKNVQDESKLRNKINEEGDSLMEKEKMRNGVDIEPEADEWVAKPSPQAFDNSKSSDK
ncbi:hypothetical protein Q5741_13730 [Paenibacillus sp. JX-17]|uniref:Multidrug transporter n=1 Tax=Paenibacillus lacisoli TaxID=3064525 RepID=A0ABT9CIG7_9BACL|nr:hypothetical protein [Paenibacillus sp. JX-17]MDO7907466.1 hypothetical protein [Paenibacillus sp. JX-17]